MPASGKSDEEEKKDELDDDDDVDDDEDDDEPAAEGDEDEDVEDVPATAAGKASAARLLDLLVEKKALQLHAKKPGAELIEAVARLLESPLPVKARATKLSDAIVDSEDVDEFFLDDETLIELLKRW